MDTCARLAISALFQLQQSAATARCLMLLLLLRDKMQDALVNELRLEADAAACRLASGAVPGGMIGLGYIAAVLLTQRRSQC